MKKIWRLTAFVGAAMLALSVAVSVGAAANPHTTYTCTKVKRNGDLDVRVEVPEPAVGGLTGAGFTCAANSSEGNTDPDSDEGGDSGDTGQDDPGDKSSEKDEQDSGEVVLTASAPSVEPPAESRSLYCATTPVNRGNGDDVGVALNLTKDQGQHMVEMGLATPAIFYEGLGASCDVLPGYKYSGFWVDNVGSVVAGVAMYPLFVTA